MSEVRLLVVSCPRRKPIQNIWHLCRATNWPDCPYPIDVLSPQLDIGWNANLLLWLSAVSEPYVLLMLDDHFLDRSVDSYTQNVQAVRDLMNMQPDIAMIKLQAGNAWPPELPFPAWDRLGEYDRKHHPFKRTNLVPTLFRRIWLQRLASAVLKACGTEKDRGRQGALEFEVEGTLLTEDAKAWPERMLGIRRPNADGGGGRSLLNCVSNDGVREGKLQTNEKGVSDLMARLPVIAGVEAFL